MRDNITFSKVIAVPGATEADIVAKTKKFLKEYTEHLERTTWEQVKGKNVNEASLDIKSPRLLIMDVTISIAKEKYTYDIKGIEFYYHEVWRPAKIVLGNTKSEFNDIRTGLLGESPIFATTLKNVLDKNKKMKNG